jgi:hypothetical protein
VDAGGDHDTTADESPGDPVTPVGAPGGVGPVGVTGFEGADAGPLPMALAADTVNVYVVPLFTATVTVVVGGEPFTVVGTCAADPANGVIV